MDKSHMNITETAEYLNVSVSLLRKLVRGRDIPFYRMGYRIMFSKDSLDKWIANKERTENKNDIFGL